jgi:methyl-accepting chemotaxis protein
MKNDTPSTPSNPSGANSASGLKALKISSKITLLSFGLVILTVTILTLVLMIQKGRLAPALTKLLNQQAYGEAGKIVKTIHDTCVGAENLTRRQLEHSLDIGRESLQKYGVVSLRATENVSWDAENQATHQKAKVDLPKFMLGATWVGQNASLDTPSPVVDDMKHYTSAEGTIFQRMNDSGDMLRVATTLTTSDGNRGIGTYVPAANPDGTPNQIVATVLKGETYRGRAVGINVWYSAIYEPLWDAGHQKVIGMLFAGINMTEAARSVRQSILNITLGKSGYIFAFGTKGSLKGSYIVSQKGEQDGANVWETKDANGKFIVQEIIKTGLASPGGNPAIMEYVWKSANDAAPREKFAAVTYYEPWDWVIGASAYYDEYKEAQNTALNTLTQMLWWTAGISGVLAAIALGVSYRLSRSISRPLNELAETADRIAKGDNTARAQIATKDEIGQLAEAFNEMIDARVKAKEDTDDYKRLQEGIQQLLHVTSDASDGDLTVRAKVTEGALGNVCDALNLMLENVGDTLREVQGAANRVASSATEIQASSEQLSQGSVKQTGEIINTTTAVQEMAANIESVSNNATSASEAASRALNAAENGAQAVQQVIDGMERIRQNVQAGAKKIKRLGERSMEISTIVNTISQISSQTDMLALNAAIEAARAGEHGRGFTVVAEEVRKLAERTAAATKEIEKLIAGIQAETNESVSAMEQQTVEVETESKVVQSTGGELARIRESSNQSAELINEINLAAKQQVRGANGVVKAMETVSTIAQQAQAGAGQTKRATESLASLSSDLLNSLGKFKLPTNGN